MSSETGTLFSPCSKMDLKISVFLLFVLFASGRSLNCYQCAGLSGTCSQTTCSTGVTSCFVGSLAIGSNPAITVQKCGLATGCPSGTINFGIGKISGACCNTDLCNTQITQGTNVAPNGKSCYYCDGQNCTNTVNCSGTEDNCFKATAVYSGQNQTVKGCMSKAVCDFTSTLDSVVANVSCCSGNLCNGVESVSQSFLFLFCSLLSSILLYQINL
ncbi:urokinase plasminogen activator surface receptor-like [Puntigrus tetrazona]|uniref:urokinase plasminogen activator surface receptor-like n=1 Tax=Puntigrus tetrazona TaxID=1606681 RepID=UPI001C8ABC85|nr:urokinase plasminogen activator surface receptor-like [Puntigrus tetrazona]